MGTMRIKRMVLCLAAVLVCGRFGFALDPSLNISQYAHRSWTLRGGFSLGNIYGMTQSPDGYLWLASEFGLFRFDGIRAVRWQPPAGQHLPEKPNCVRATRDGTLWIGTLSGLASWNGSRLTLYPMLDGLKVETLVEDREGTVWVGTWSNDPARPARLCAIGSGRVQCYREGTFGQAVEAWYDDSSGTLWAFGSPDVWRWTPDSPQRYPTPRNITALSDDGQGGLLMAVYGAGVRRLVGGRVESYQIRSPDNPDRMLVDREVNSNQLLRDRDGGLWIVTVERGLIHVHNGRTDTFRKSDGLSGDVVLRIFEDREGSIWVSTTEGLDRFRELAVTTLSAKEGLSSDATSSVLASSDGSIWVGTHDGLTRLRNGRTKILRKGTGLPGDATESLFQDDHGRIWATFAGHGLAYFRDGEFIAVPGSPDDEVSSITGDKAGNLWLSGNKGLWHFVSGRLVEHFPWPALARYERAAEIVSHDGGVWLSFWVNGGVLYFKDGRIRASYGTADGLGQGHVPDLRIDRHGALWAATEQGVSRIKDGHIATLTSNNGLPCNTIHWSMEDEDRSLWLYTACGLVRVARNEVDAWIADPKRAIETTVWDGADGVRIRSSPATAFGPKVAKSSDGKIWFLTAEGVSVFDPRHLVSNKMPPGVRIEKVVADQQTAWQNLPGGQVGALHLPPRVRDLTIDYTALSFVSPEKIHFKYKLEGQDTDWREVVNDREVQYSNLGPGDYRFRVIASNSSGVWNETGDSLEFSIAPTYYQTNWFRALCVSFLLALLWAVYYLRVRQLHHEFEMTLDARVGERTRIARELHDTLLQSFQGVLLRFQATINLLPGRPADARQVLEEAVEHASEAIAEGRDAIAGLRMSTVEKNDLALAIETAGEELAAGQDGGTTPFQVVVEGTSRDLHPILRDEVYRLTTEALRNAFRHARAKKVEVEIRYGIKYLRLRVRDDGKGIDPQVLRGEGRQGHYGLHGMRERAKLAGGKLTIWTELDSGTEIELVIPAAKAYVKPTRPFWSFGKRWAPETDEKETIEHE